MVFDMMNLLTVPGQHEYGGKPFPLAIKAPEGSLSEGCEWASGVAGELSKAAFEHGAVLVQGLPMTSPEDFDAIVRAFNYPNFSYADSLSNAYRINFTPRVFSANEAPSDITIFLHHEMAQTPIYPSKLIFFCQKAAAPNARQTSAVSAKNRNVRYIESTTMIIQTKDELSYCCREKNGSPDNRHRPFEAPFLQDKSPGACLDAVFAKATSDFQLVW